jgi:hypothetical protein
MSTVQQDFKRRLARAEITVSAVHAADLHAASNRRFLRALVHICEVIRERFLLMGLDPALAVSLRKGEEAAAKLAAIPETEALRTADEALTHSDLDDCREDANSVRAKIQRMADYIADDIINKGVQPDFAKASVAELWAFCVAMEDLARAIKSEDKAEIPTGPCARVGVFRNPNTVKGVVMNQMV